MNSIRRQRFAAAISSHRWRRRWNLKGPFALLFCISFSASDGPKNVSRRIQVPLPQLKVKAIESGSGAPYLRRAFWAATRALSASTWIAGIRVKAGQPPLPRCGLPRIRRPLISFSWTGSIFDRRPEAIRACKGGCGERTRREVEYEIHEVRVKVWGWSVPKWRVGRVREVRSGLWLDSEGVVVGWLSSEAIAKEAAEIDLENLAPRPNRRRTYSVESMSRGSGRRSGGREAPRA